MSARILVVEDEEALCALLDYNLQKEGFSVTLCRDGEEALMRVTEDKPDLVLLDWMLPRSRASRSAASCGCAATSAICRSLC